MPPKVAPVHENRDQHSIKFAEQSRGSVRHYLFTNPSKPLVHGSQSLVLSPDGNSRLYKISIVIEYGLDIRRSALP